MVHVTFNEKVECHQYNPSSTMSTTNSGNVSRSASAQETSLNYSVEFLKQLRENPLSKVCPDIVKKGIADNSGWTGSGCDPDEDMGRPIIKNGSVFLRPLNTYSARPRRALVPFFKNNPNVLADNTNREMYKPIEPIGSSRFNTQSRNYPSGNPMPHFADNFQNRNLLPDFNQRYKVAKRTSDTKPAQEDERDEGEPEWYKSGPTSRNDCVDLHGFEGQENHPKNDQLGCVDGNVSGGPASGASSNTVSPQPKAKSTPAKNDAYRHNRPGLGRSNNWRNNVDIRQSGGPPFLNDFFKNFSGVQNQANWRGSPHVLHVEDVESANNYDKLRFRQMVANLQSQNLNRSRYYVQQEPVATVPQILSEVDKILRTTTDPLFKLPEVRAIINKIVESANPPVSIMELIKNPLTEPLDREAEPINAAIKIITQAKQNAAHVLRGHPTESELKAHTEAIMQDAIIKKRIEKLSNDLLKSGKPLPNQLHFQQLLQQCALGRFEHHFQSGHFIDHGTNFSQENILNRWFTPTLLNKGLSGELPQIPNDHLRSEELENLIKLKGNEKDVKYSYK